MFTVTQLLVACVMTAAATSGIAWLIAKTWVDNALAAELRRHEQAERQSREQFTRELQVLQHSLSEEVEALRERSRRPLKTLVDSFLN